MRFADFQRDPVTVVRQIYGYFELRLSSRAEQAMAAWITANPQDKHGRRAYTLAQFGLTETAAHERFADYMKRHQLYEAL